MAMSTEENIKATPDRNRIISSLKYPLVWLIIVSLLVVSLAFLMGLMRVGAADDTASYLHAAAKSPIGMLNDVRPIGYPLFLKLIATVSPRFSILPVLQLLIHLMVVFFLFFSLKKFGASGWQALAVSVGFLLTVLEDPTVSCIMSDFVGRTLVVATIASLFLLASNKRGLIKWFVFAFFLFVTCIVRPGNLILIALAPLLGGLFFILSKRENRKDKAKTHVFMIKVAICAIVPWIVFCGFRWVVVGDFAVSSFSGYQLSGLSVGLLDRSTIETEVSDELKPFAVAVLQERERQKIPPAVMGALINLKTLRQNFPKYIWLVAAPQGERLYGRNPVVINRKLKELSTEILKRHKKLYAVWFIGNLWEDLGGLLRYGLVLQVLLAIGFLLYVGRAVTGATHEKNPGAIRVKIFGGISLAEENTRVSLIIAAVSFSICTVVVTALMAPNLGRYSTAAGILLPSIASEWIFVQIKSLSNYFKWFPTSW